MTEEGQATGQETPPAGEQKPQDDPLKKLSNDLFTRIGRLDAERKRDNEAILARLEALGTALPKQEAQQDGTDQLLDRALKGDFQGSVAEVMDKREQAKEMLRQRNQAKLEKAIGDMEEVPMFKDVKDGVRKIAADLVFAKGYSPEDAVAFAYEKSRADHLSRLIGGAGEFDSASLETSGGGSRREDSGEKKGKLNSEGKKAFEKNKPYFKDEAEFIKSMSPMVRARFVG